MGRNQGEHNASWDLLSEHLGVPRPQGTGSIHPLTVLFYVLLQTGSSWWGLFTTSGKPWLSGESPR